MPEEKKVLYDNIEVLRLEIKNLVGMVIEQYKKIIESIKINSTELALEVIKNDGEINSLTEDIDYDTIKVIADYHLKPQDLRRVITINKLAYELERIADYAKNLAEYVITGKKMNVDKASEFIHFDKMFDCILKMLETNLQAFLEENKSLAREALLMDNEIDKMYKDNFNELLNRFKNTYDELEQHMISRALILNKQIERSGDHLTNISEQILYLIKGKKN
ncbi:MAG TPA: phosphate signaling complex protein PhoU [Haloplasmataceae bacterium]